MCFTSKAFGQIIKSLFILRYLDDLTLRQAVEQQLSRVELANRFTRDVAVGNPREFLQAEKEDQEFAEACNRLIKNSIVCWNYLYLEHKLATLRDVGQKTGTHDRDRRSFHALHGPTSISWANMTSPTRSCAIRLGYDPLEPLHDQHPCPSSVSRFVPLCKKTRSCVTLIDSIGASEFGGREPE